MDPIRGPLRLLAGCRQQIYNVPHLGHVYAAPDRRRLMVALSLLLGHRHDTVLAAMHDFVTTNCSRRTNVGLSLAQSCARRVISQRRHVCCWTRIHIRYWTWQHQSLSPDACDATAPWPIPSLGGPPAISHPPTRMPTSPGASGWIAGSPRARYFEASNLF